MRRYEDVVGRRMNYQREEVQGGARIYGEERGGSRRYNEGRARWNGVGGRATRIEVVRG